MIDNPSPRKVDLERVKDVLYAVLERPAQAREAELRRRCGDDQQLLASVRQLLPTESQVGGPIPELRTPEADASSFPALKYELHGETVFRVLPKAPVVQVGRATHADLPSVKIPVPMMSRAQFVIRTKDDEHWIENSSTSNPTRLNGFAIDSPQRLVHAARIRVGKLEMQFCERPLQRAVQTIPDAADDEATPEAPAVQRVELKRGTLIIGRAHQSGQFLELPHPQVSRLHARVDTNGAEFRIHDLNSSVGTFVNGRRVRGRTALRDGDSIGIGPYLLEFRGGVISVHSGVDRLELEVRDLSYHIKIEGSLRALLDRITLRVEPGRFVAILGPSGSGKSTLLRALSGQIRPTMGTVNLNREDLLRQFEALKSHIAYVPQHEILHRSLTVHEALEYSARLRLPRDTAKSEIDERVNALLTQFDLDEHRDTRIGRLSGGQMRRVSLANELLADPDLLLLDEVTSGLDVATDHDVMQAIRSLTQAGKTVLLVTHNVEHIPDFCDDVTCLTVGGRVAYHGPPDRALAHFGLESLGDIYRALRDPKLAERWRSNGRDDAPKPDSETRDPADRAARTDRWSLGRVFAQTMTLTRRYARLLVRDRQNLGFLLGQPIVVGVLLAIVFGRLDTAVPTEAIDFANLLFLAAVSCIWFGVSASAKEIVKERALYGQESRSGIGGLPYFLSKTIVLSGLLAVQCATLFGVLALGCELDGNGVGQLALFWSTGLIGMMGGLAISAVARNSDVAVSLVPIALIPQVILGGGVVALSGAALWIARVTVPNYWCYAALQATHDVALPHLGEVPDLEVAAAVMGGMFIAAAVMCLVGLRRR